jgi:hypothetical protein
MRIVLPAVHQSTNTGRTVSADCLVSTSAINNTRLPVAINNISRTVAPGTNEGGDFGSELAGCGKAENAVAPIQMLRKEMRLTQGPVLGREPEWGSKIGPKSLGPEALSSSADKCDHGQQESAFHSSVAASPTRASCCIQLRLNNLAP